ncbi:hypothetical protein TIFTF001_028301 [Ficus carica]|uniref:Uncharacterized protein n=1 Tax=Ficus carica TaxID=3494 RepID=A0AA88IWD2_FICCA|nr:hypothetical protein TIFTF001_028301 [Ficus carica]
MSRTPSKLGLPPPHQGDLGVSLRRPTVLLHLMGMGIRICFFTLYAGDVKAVTRVSCFLTLRALYAKLQSPVRSYTGDSGVFRE